MVTVAVLKSITVTPTNPSIANGTSVQLTANGTFSDGTSQLLTAPLLSWTSTAPATVDPTGLVTGKGVGTATVSATQAGVTGSTDVMVTAAVLKSIAITPTNPSIANGTSVQLTATGTFSDGSTQPLTAPLLSWASTGSATVDPTGVVTGVAVGSATITATQAGVSGSTTVTVTNATVSRLIVATVFNPPPPIPTSISVSVAVKELPLIATAVFSDGTVQDVTLQTDWMSSDPTVAFINSTHSIQTNGQLNPKKVGGPVTITGTVVISGTTFQGTLKVTVTM
jgi:hypothetical protein